MDKLIEKALTAKRESKNIEFKSAFDPSSKQDWCEIFKDIIAMANTGGGVILFGVDNKGVPTSYDCKNILHIDPADIINKMEKYIGNQGIEIELLELKKGRKKIASIVIQGVSIPIVFMKPGTYDIGSNRQKTAFKEGSVYFRHGAKSEPGHTDDLRRAFQRELSSVKKSWLGGIRKVMKAPKEAEVVVLAKEVMESNKDVAKPIRIVDDPSAPAYRKIDSDITYPYRMKELIREVNRKLPTGISINSYDTLAIGSLYDIKRKKKYCYKPKFATHQYSDAYVEWIVSNYNRDKKFFEKARSKYRKLSSTR